MEESIFEIGNSIGGDDPNDNPPVGEVRQIKHAVTKQILAWYKVTAVDGPAYPGHLYLIHGEIIEEPKHENR